MLCPNCGWRKEYQPAALHDAKLATEPTHEFRKIQFGQRNKEITEKKDIFTPPKSQLNKLVSWLLQ